MHTPPHPTGVSQFGVPIETACHHAHSRTAQLPPGPCGSTNPADREHGAHRSAATRAPSALLCMCTEQRPSAADVGVPRSRCCRVDWCRLGWAQRPPRCAPWGGRRPATAPTRAPNLACRPRLQPACIEHVRAARCCVVCMGARVPCRTSHRGHTQTPAHPHWLHARAARQAGHAMHRAGGVACMHAGCSWRADHCMCARPVSPACVLEVCTLTHTRSTQTRVGHCSARARSMHAVWARTRLPVDGCPARPYPVLASTPTTTPKSAPHSCCVRQRADGGVHMHTAVDAPCSGVDASPANHAWFGSGRKPRTARTRVLPSVCRTSVNHAQGRRAPPSCRISPASFQL